MNSKINTCSDDERNYRFIKAHFDRICTIFDANDGKALKFENRGYRPGYCRCYDTENRRTGAYCQSWEESDIPLLILSALDSLKDKLAGYRTEPMTI